MYPQYEYEDYYAVTDDDLARIVQIRWCVANPNNNNEPMDFRGFEVGFMSPISGYTFRTYGTVNGTDDTATVCTTEDLSGEELMYFQVFFDRNDVEGIYFQGGEGTEWYMRADGRKGSPKF